MPSSCCAFGCSNRKTEGSELVFYRFPPKKKHDQRQLWVQRIKRKDWPKDDKDLQNARLCSAHFISGKKSDCPSDPDFAPSVFSHQSETANSISQRKRRYERLHKRQKVEEQQDYFEFEELPTMEEELADEDKDELIANLQRQLQDSNTELDSVKQELTEAKKELRNSKLIIKRYRFEVSNRIKEFNDLKKKTKKIKRSNLFRFRYIRKNKKKFLFYTGISEHVFKIMSEYAKLPHVAKQLKPEDQLFLLLVKLRMGSSNKDLAFRFGLSSTTVSRIIRSLLPKLAQFMLNRFFSWPEKMSLRKNLPQCFKKKYQKCVCIIDCTEIFIERPFNLNARAQTWSNYKNTNTIKYLVACAPTGAVTFLSEGWGGRVSDKEITIKSGFLEYIENGDQVLADRGFTISEEIATHGGILEIPAFTKGKAQLGASEVDGSRQIANVRIHIERVIGRMRKFNILNTTIPISQVDLLDDIMVCVAGLVNLCQRIV